MLTNYAGYTRDREVIEMSVEIPSSLQAFVRGLNPEEGVWIAGKARAASDGKTFPVYDPATTEVIASVSSGTRQDASAAVDAAEAAFEGWADTSPRERAEILRKAFTLMLEQAEPLAGLMAWENGKAMSDAKGEVTYAAEFFRWYSEEAVRSDGDYAVPPAGGTRLMVTHKPIGIAALITPWNVPAAMATRKIAPALAAGCTVVLKMASETPLTALAVMRILKEAGVPDGVVNMVPSQSSADISETWLADPRVRIISFTGSTAVGSLLMQQAAKRIVNSSMELGGNASFIVGANADVDAAVEGTMVAKFRNGGQACTAANRLYVNASVAQEFKEKLCAKVKDLKVGSAFTEGVEIGPLVNRKALDGLHQLLRDAESEGAEVLASAELPDLEGYFLPPQVIEVKDNSSSLFQNEIFGPIAPILVWSDEEQMLKDVNSTEMGLASYIYGDLQWALRTAEKIDAGMVGVNRGLVSDPAAPFGGVKQSGIGREGGREGVREFQETQYFSVAW